MNWNAGDLAQILALVPTSYLTLRKSPRPWNSVLGIGMKLDDLFGRQIIPSQSLSFYNYVTITVSTDAFLKGS